jgi:hypothetical protein
MAGPLVDRVLEPATGSPGWQLVAPVVGDTAGSGIGLLLVFTGLVIVGITLAMLILPRVRQLETLLPDYEALVDTGVESLNR